MCEIRVLIVDDQKAARMKLRRMPVWHPHTRFILCGEARNGAEALSRIGQGDVDILVSDIQMPVMDGLELLRHVTAEFPNVPAVLHSDHADFEYARKGIVLGAFDYILKPVTAETLLGVLERAAEAIDRKRESVGASPKEAAAVLCRDIRAGRALADRQIRMYAEGLRAVHEDQSDCGFQCIRQGIGLLLRDLSSEEIDLMRSDLASLAAAWATRQENPQDAFFLQIRFIERAYMDLYLPEVSNVLVRKAVETVLAENGVPKTVGAVAEALYVHRNHLSQTFSRSAGITLSEYIVRAKMYAARVLLLKPERTVQEVGGLLGYEDEEHFAKLFRHYAGVLPREYRKQML